MSVLASNVANNPLRQRLISALGASDYLSSHNLRIFAGNNTVIIGVR
ncbi:MAG: hypothetical protein FWE03_01770 [Firmicutes bacterium]|nr:hypothetical protein [Bacillota bacterium]